MDRYPDISEHGLIGDLQTAALVSTDGKYRRSNRLVLLPSSTSGGSPSTL